MQDMIEKIRQSRAAGYTDEEIMPFLQNAYPDKVKASLDAGYSATDIMNHIVGGNPVKPSDGPIDDRTGAGWQERMILGSAGDDATRFERARALWGDDAQMDKDGRISFTNKDTGRRTYVNPSGFDMGDIAGAGREIFSGIASIPAMIGTSFSGPGALVAGSAAGAAGSQLFDTLAAARARDLAAQRGNAVPKKQDIKEAAVDTAMEFGAGVIGGRLAQGAGRFIGKTLSPMKQEVVQAFDRLGLNIPTVGTGVGGRSAGVYEGVLSSLPGGSGTMERAAASGRSGLDDALTATAEKMAGGRPVAATPEDLGTAALAAADASKSGFQRANSSWYDAFTKRWGGSQAALTNTEQAIDDMTSGLSPEARAAVSGRLRSLFGTELTDQGNGELNLNTVKAARTRIGEMLKAPSSIDTSGVEQGQLRRLYAALGRDYEDAITDPAAQAAWKRHTAWEAGQHQARDLLGKKVFGQNGPKTAKQVADALLSSELPAEVVQALKKALPKKAFDDLRAGILRNAGRPLASVNGATVGEAAPERLTKMLGVGKGAYSPEVQRLLWGNGVNDVRTVAEAMANLPKNANTSKTAMHNAMTALVTGGAGGALALGSPMALAGAAGSVASPWALSKLTTSPLLIKMLSKPQSNASRAILEKALPQAGRFGGMLGEFEAD